MAVTADPAIETDQPVFDPVRANAILSVLRRRLVDANEGAVILEADIEMLRGQIESQQTIIEQISKDNVRLRSLYEPDSLLEGAAEPHVHEDIQDHGDGPHSH